MHPVSRLLPLAVIAATVLTGCGSGTTDTSTEQAPPVDAPAAPSAPVTRDDEPEPVAAYRAWLDALSAEDAEAACARHAPGLTIDLRYEAILLDRASLGTGSHAAAEDRST